MVSTWVGTKVDSNLPGGADEANTVREESAVDRVEDSQFSKSLDGQEKEDTNNQVTQGLHQKC